jgi:uncharacterized protein (TIGR03435 family)
MQPRITHIGNSRCTLVAALLCIAVATMYGQAPATPTKPTANEAAKLPAFDVATIRRMGAKGLGIAGFLSYPDGKVFVGAASIKMLIYLAFDVQLFQISGGPAWADKDLYDVEALPPNYPAPQAQNSPSYIANPSDVQRKMLQSLLIDRFGLKFHREIKEGPVFLLTRDSTKLQMQAPKDPDADPRGVLQADGELFGINTSMPYLASRLSDYLHRTVLDQTDLKGSYDFHVEVYDLTNTDITSAAIESLKQIGLKLKAGKGPVETIVIDSVSHPTEN